MTVPFKVYIPARYASRRLPGKPLLKIGDKPLLRHVYDSARASGAAEVVIVTDDERIRDTATMFGASVMMTSSSHESGTERIGEAVRNRDEDDDCIIVNVQGDEFGLPPQLIEQVAESLHGDSHVSVATLCEGISQQEDCINPDVVKVVFNQYHHALYFSRSPVPARAGEEHLVPVSYRHIGLYAYRAGFLKTWSELPSCGLEQSEKLEQLRALYHGYAIRVDEACVKGGIGVDTEADLEKARSAVNSEE